MKQSRVVKPLKQRSIVKPKLCKQLAVDELLAQLPTMKPQELQRLWRELFGQAPSPALYRQTLIPILAYRIQEKAFGGLKEATARRLRELADAHAGGAKALPSLRPRAGTRYVREHGGKLHEVTVLASGFEYGGTPYRSLTEIANFITGSKWSGPAFFGLKRKARSAAA